MAFLQGIGPAELIIAALVLAAPITLLIVRVASRGKAPRVEAWAGPIPATPSPPPLRVRRCPYCAEEIDAEAIRCPWCESDLTAPISRGSGEEPTLPQLAARKCPFCAEEIRAEVTKCPWCESNLSRIHLSAPWQREAPPSAVPLPASGSSRPEEDQGGTEETFGIYRSPTTPPSGSATDAEPGSPGRVGVWSAPTWSTEELGPPHAQTGAPTTSDRSRKVWFVLMIGGPLLLAGAVGVTVGMMLGGRERSAEPLPPRTIDMSPAAPISSPTPQASAVAQPTPAEPASTGFEAKPPPDMRRFAGQYFSIWFPRAWRIETREAWRADARGGSFSFFHTGFRDATDWDRSKIIVDVHPDYPFSAGQKAEELRPGEYHPTFVLNGEHPGFRHVYISGGSLSYHVMIKSTSGDLFVLLMTAPERPNGETRRLFDVVLGSLEPHRQ